MNNRKDYAWHEKKNNLDVRTANTGAWSFTKSELLQIWITSSSWTSFDGIGLVRCLTRVITVAVKWSALFWSKCLTKWQRAWFAISKNNNQKHRNFVETTRHTETETALAAVVVINRTWIMQWHGIHYLRLFIFKETHLGCKYTCTIRSQQSSDMLEHQLSASFMLSDLKSAFLKIVSLDKAVINAVFNYATRTLRIIK